MDLGNRINELRNNACLTQEQLAEKLDVSRQAVTKWEKNDSTPDISKIIELSNVFGVSTDYLIKGKQKYWSSDKNKKDDLEPIKSFLCAAKTNTYAAKAAEIESSRWHSHDLSYEEGRYSYLDSYFGGEKFAGEEVLYVDRIPFWSMNYIGRVLDSDFSSDFLKECLQAVNKEKPFRGPEIFQNGNFTYHCKVKGDFNWFNGEEVIFFQSRKVFECLIHGGILK
ncbi:MAG: DUF5680 domain-containing protein [Spirochaetales bacterium]|nr:DUF5680 domain-containing protein [Spirochaetales bacterium]